MFTRTFWIDAGERAIRTFAQTAGGLLTASATGILDVDWVSVMSVSALAMVISLLTSLSAGTVNPATGASMGTSAPVRNVPGGPVPEDGSVVSVARVDAPESWESHGGE